MVFIHLYKKNLDPVPQKTAAQIQKLHMYKS